MRFFVGLHQPNDAKHFTDCLISVNRLYKRRSDFEVNNWVLDSGAFTEVMKYGGFRYGVEEYAAVIRRWARCGNLLAAVAQDYICNPIVLERTGLTVNAHQQLTIERYDKLIEQDTAGVYIMPIIQGNTPAEYVQHLQMYGARLAPGAWVGVGSLVSKSADIAQVYQILSAIVAARPDIKLHGFGLKAKSFMSPQVKAALYSADSMAWSFAARYEGRNQNDYREALKYADNIINNRLPVRNGVQLYLF